MARRWQPRQLHHRQVAFVVWNKRYPRQPWFDALNQAEAVERRLASLLTVLRMTESLSLPRIEPLNVLAPGTRFDAWTPPGG